MRTPRRRAREFAVQTLYLSLIQPDESNQSIIDTIRNSDAFISAKLAGKRKCPVDEQLYLQLAQGCLKESHHCRETISPYLERDTNHINPIEMAVLLIACYELSAMPHTPYPVIINEAVEIAKVYGGTDGYKFINGVLDKLVVKLRPNDPKPKYQ